VITSGIRSREKCWESSS